MCVYSLESANILAREFPRVQCPEKRNVWDPAFLLNRVYIDSFPRKELQSYNVFLGMAKLKTDFLRILPSMTLIYSACCVVFFANMCFSFTQPHNIYTYIYIHVYVYIYCQSIIAIVICIIIIMFILTTVIVIMLIIIIVNLIITKSCFLLWLLLLVTCHIIG